VVAAVLMWPAIAFGEGRPQTRSVQFRANDPHAVYVAASFGLVVSHDDGCSFRWLCARSIGYDRSFAAKYRIADDGAVFATTVNGLRVSRDGGCTFTTATAERPSRDPGRIADAWIDAIDIGPTGDVWVATADSGKPNDVYRSTDHGVTFAPRGLRSPAIWWKSVAIAPSRAQRVYVTGYQVAGRRGDGGALPPTTHFAISDDDGARWRESALAGVQLGPTPLVYAMAVDPRDPDRVFMVSAGAAPPNGDRLYQSRDGGDSWREVLVAPGAVTSVAIAADRVIATTRGGTFESRDGGATFTPAATALACAAVRGDGALLACGGDAAVMRAEGDGWRKLLAFGELAGPVDCPAGTPQHDACAPEWPALQRELGATGPTAACPAPIEPPAVPASPAAAPAPAHAGGCCDAGAPASGALLLAAAVGGWLSRRRLSRRWARTTPARRRARRASSGSAG
jgi:hypothetical protein